MYAVYCVLRSRNFAYFCGLLYVIPNKPNPEGAFCLRLFLHAELLKLNANQYFSIRLHVSNIYAAIT